LERSFGQSPLLDASGYDRAPFIPEFYDYVVPYAARPDIGFYVEAARQYGGPVLELGCGTGRILIPTARAGIDISGLDASEGMLKVCRARLDTEPADVRRRTDLYHGDIRHFDLGRRFQLITLPFRPFQYLLTVEEQLACLSAIWHHLELDGQLVFDLFNPSVHHLAKPVDPAETDDEPPFTHPDGRTVTRRSRILERDLANQTFAGELVYDVTHPGGRTERLVHHYRFRYLFRFEAEHLLARAGFSVEHVYSRFDHAPYGSQYPGELIFVARRQPAG
jgi:SAM-dependent methyltransferase